MTGGRPSWVHCAQMEIFDGGSPPKQVFKTWCGRLGPPGMEFQFTNASHAILNGLRGGRTLLCASCSMAIADALKAGSYQHPSRRGRRSTRRDKGVESP